MIRPVDCDVHHAVPDLSALFPFLADRWVDYCVRAVSTVSIPRSIQWVYRCRPGQRPGAAVARPDPTRTRCAPMYSTGPVLVTRS